MDGTTVNGYTYGPGERQRVPVITGVPIHGTDLLVTLLEGLRKKITLGQLVEAQTRLAELLTSITISPALFVPDDAKPARTDHQVLVSLCQLAEEQLAELKHLRAAVGASATSRSSVQLEQGAKEVRLSVKVYENSDVTEAGINAVAEFATLFREVERQQANQWRETVDAGSGK